ncbi:hypothetical protein A2V80_02920 [Candidatus Woesebacteria bacterium RBG_16_39_8b]|uniref:Transport permease protein n=1 Tax=Candidatus Woesebacteria bacterium RBG_16_39_8b TaxID=1802482 RepID=A0A1F7XBP6_9BACT|nr:MAG: hypothetical protein A2V80_02920 [Candidatus Woesebacteria bacterium RBG_16_39_8b]
MVRKMRWRNYLDFLWAMTEKEIKARYKRAVFGFLWVILNPLLQMLIIGAIFSFFIRIPNYFLFLFTGLLPWEFISLSLTKATPSIVYERSLLQKAKFPIEVIPISIILSNFFNMLISFGLFCLILIFLRRITFLSLALFVPTFIWLLLFTIGLTLLTSSLQVKYRDVSFFIQTILILWFYATPVLYSLSLIPAQIHLLFSLNPLTSIFELLHFALLNQGLIDFKIMIINILISIFIFIMGVIIFKREHKYFVDWL